MARNIIVCCDGTGNEVNTELSNVLKLYRVLKWSDEQVVYYNPGIGTYSKNNTWQKYRQKIKGLCQLATGYGLDGDVIDAYNFLCRNYERGDKIWLFGFSRGAYTVRVLAGFLNVIGLLSANQNNLADYAFSAYKKSINDVKNKRLDAKAEKEETVSALAEAWHFSRVSRTKKVQIEFIGVWDTVSSVIAPRVKGISLDLEILRYTDHNLIVKTFRQAIAIDERRRMFRLKHWNEPQKFRVKPFKPASDVAQDIKQVWFAGVHSDIGGGYPESESSLSKYPLDWMLEEARAHGLLINQSMANQLVKGINRLNSRYKYVAPDEAGCIHDSLISYWKLIEWLPKRLKWKEWPERRGFLGWYLPCGEPRVIPENAKIHRSVQWRMENIETYRPVNLPESYEFVDTLRRKKM